MVGIIREIRVMLVENWNSSNLYAVAPLYQQTKVLVLKCYLYDQTRNLSFGELNSVDMDNA